MKVTYEISDLDGFEFWSGAKDTYNRIREIGMQDELLACIEEILGEEATETEINDFVWFEDETIKDYLGFDFWEYDSLEEAEEAENEDDEDENEDGGDE